MTFQLYILPLLCLILHTQSIIPYPNRELETVKQWNLLTYNFPWDWPSNDQNFYNPQRVVATGIEIGYNRLFVATPRLYGGVPATLSTISKGGFGDNPVLEAYPNWNFHTSGRQQYRCEELGLVSVYRMKIDSCNRLWALDSGASRSLEDFEITCPPKILIFDLRTDEVVRRIDFPQEVIRNNSLFTNIVVDETTSLPGNNCDDVFVYITDTVAPGIVVYDSARDLTWRVTHPSMFADEAFAVSTIDNYQFTLRDGIVGIAFDARAGIVYFEPLATDRLFSISTAALRAGPATGSQVPVQLVGRKSSQGIGLAVNPYNGAVYFSPFTETAIAAWNPNTNTHNVIAYDPAQLQFVADMKTPATDPGYLYIISSRFHRYSLRNVDANDINTRILRIPISTESQPSFGFNNNAFQQQYPLSTGFQRPAYNNYNQQPFGVQKPISFVHNNYYNTIDRPYKFEANVSPFASLNSGEEPYYYPKPKPTGWSYNSNFNDFNGLRFAKSVSYNSTVVH